MAIRLVDHAIINLTEIKAAVWDDTGGQDDRLNLLINRLTEAAEAAMGRDLVSRGALTEYYSLDCYTPDLYLRVLPIIDITSVHESCVRTYNADSLLIVGTDFVAYNEVGKLVRTATATWGREAWEAGFEAMKVIYTGGYSRGWLIVAGENDALDITEGVTGDASATLTAGNYATGALVAVEIATRLNVAATDNIWTCTYSSTTGKFTIGHNNAETGGIEWLTGANAATSIGGRLGYDMSADDTGEVSYAADAASYAEAAIPYKIKDAALTLASRMWRDSQVALEGAQNLNDATGTTTLFPMAMMMKQLRRELEPFVERAHFPAPRRG